MVIYIARLLKNFHFILYASPYNGNREQRWRTVRQSGQCNGCRPAAM